MLASVLAKLRERLLRWRTPPGYVRISSRRLIALQRAAIRAQELELEAAQLHAEADRLEAAAADRDREAAADVLISAQCHAAGVTLTSVETADLLQELPQTSAGTLHEPAFLALVGNALLAHRLAASIPTIGDN